MARSPFGWDLPPGVTSRMIDEAAGGDFTPVEEAAMTFVLAQQMLTGYEGTDSTIVERLAAGADEAYATLCELCEPYL